MKSLAKNWKTTLAGVIALAITAVHIFDPALLTNSTYLTIVSVLGGLGLISAKDGNVTGGTVQQ